MHYLSSRNLKKSNSNPGIPFSQKLGNVWCPFRKTSVEIIVHQPLESKVFNNPIKYIYLAKGKNIHHSIIS